MIRQRHIIVAMAAIIVSLLVALFYCRRSETYVCTVKFVDELDPTKIWSTTGLCCDDSTDNKSHMWYTIYNHEAELSNEE